jgi:hypothetical protein
MADEPQQPDEKAIASAIAMQVAAGFSDPIFMGKFGNTLQMVLAEVIKTGIVVLLRTIKPIAAGIAEGVIEGKEEAHEVLDEFAQLAIRDALGGSVASAATFRRGAGGDRANAHAAIVDRLMEILGAGQTNIEPGDASARRYLEAASRLAFESWVTGAGVEVLSGVIPFMDQIQLAGQLGESLSNILGLGRASRSVMGPLIDVVCTTPFEWKINKTYRPKLLSAGFLARELARGNLTKQQVNEELARQGYSDTRIEALLSAEQKLLSLSQLTYLERVGIISRAEAIATLRDQGYDEQIASKILILESFQRLDGIHNDVVSPAVSAYVDRRLTDGELGRILAEGLPNDEERCATHDAARVRRELNTRRLSPGQVEACVKAGILNVRDYRQALERDGYPPEDVAALELLLRHELDAAAQIDELRTQQANERAAAAAVKVAEATAKKAAIEAQRALARRGKLSDLEQAVIRGVISIARYDEVASAQYDADTVAMLVELVEQDRARYLEEQEEREDAAKRALARALDESTLRRAVFEQILSVDEYRRRLEAAGLPPDDVAILVRLLEVQVSEAAAAAAKRAEAERRAAERGLDLGRVETLVRRGIRSLEEYDRTLVDLGVDEVDRADLVELLRQRMAEDAAAQAARDEAAERAAARGLSLSQVERAVLLGVRPLSSYETFLRQQGWDVDDRALLVDTLARRLEEIQAAQERAKRLEEETAFTELPFATVQRAARLGVLSPDDFRAYLTDRGYTEADRELLVELLLLEVAETQAARARRDVIAQELAARQLSLAQLERAVKFGVKSIDDYRAFVAEQGYGAADVQTLVALLEAELAQRKDAQNRRAPVAERLAARGLDLDALEAAVVAGAVLLDDYVAMIRNAGVSPADVGQLVSLLIPAIEAAAASTTSPPETP